MKIAASSPSFSKNQLLQREIRRHFANVRLNSEGERFDKEGLIEFVGDADALVVGLEPVDGEVLDRCPNLKMISKYGVGLNNIDIEECRRRGVAIGWTGGVNRLSVAEMTLGFMLMLVRNLYRTSNELKSGTWNKSGGFQLSGKRIGIIGVGHIGRELVRLLKPFGCDIMVNDIVEQSEYYRVNDLREESKERIFADADIVTLHLPLDESTENLVDLSVMRSMKSTAYLINTARGGIVNEDDLKYALKNGIIAGAAIDVYTQEPPSDMELLSLPNLICTPHIGGNAAEAVEAMGMSAIGHLVEFFAKRGENGE